jgi:hypothetical protein
MATAIDAKADLIVGTGADTFDRLAVGADNTVLTADSSVSPTGLKWAAPTAGSFVGWQINATPQYTTVNNNTLTTVAFANESYDSDSFHDNVTNNSRATIPAGKGGYYSVTFTVQFGLGTSGYKEAGIYVNGALKTNERTAASSTDGMTVVTDTVILDLDVGDYVEVKVYQNSGGSINYWGSANGNGWATHMNGFLLGA